MALGPVLSHHPAIPGAQSNHLISSTHFPPVYKKKKKKKGVMLLEVIMKTREIIYNIPVVFSPSSQDTPSLVSSNSLLQLELPTPFPQSLCTCCSLLQEHPSFWSLGHWWLLILQISASRTSLQIYLFRSMSCCLNLFSHPNPAHLC